MKNNVKTKCFSYSRRPRMRNSSNNQWVLGNIWSFFSSFFCQVQKCSANWRKLNTALSWYSWFLLYHMLERPLPPGSVPVFWKLLHVCHGVGRPSWWGQRPEDERNSPSVSANKAIITSPFRIGTSISPFVFSEGTGYFLATERSLWRQVMRTCKM